MSAAAGRSGAALIVNVQSRKGADVMDEAGRLLEEAGVELGERYALDDPRRLRDIVRRALEQRPRMVIVGAGDGTVSQVAGLLAYTGVPLGILPLGTTNNAARSLGLPLALPAAVNVIAVGRSAQIDLGRVNEDTYFLNNATIGLNAEIAAHVSDTLKKVLGRVAYWLTGLYTLLTHRHMHVMIMEAGWVVETRTHQLVIANGTFVGGAPIEEKQAITDKTLRILRIGERSGFDYIGQVLLTALRLRQHGETEVTAIRDATITTERPRRVEVDGEPHGRTPVRVGVAPDALTAIVPAAFRAVR